VHFDRTDRGEIFGRSWVGEKRHAALGQ
jgi:hypothetical protein